MRESPSPVAAMQSGSFSSSNLSSNSVNDGGGGGGGGGSRSGSAAANMRRRTCSVPHSESFHTTDPTKLTETELDCLKEAFSLFDADHDGEISIHELGRVMRNHGLNPTDEELEDMIRNVDKNSNGAIDFNEFIEMMLRRDQKLIVDEDVAHAFRVFDRDGDGLISEEELRLTMNNLGEPLTDMEVRAMIEEADLDGDGLINFQEFARLMQSQRGLLKEDDQPDHHQLPKQGHNRGASTKSSTSKTSTGRSNSRQRRTGSKDARRF